MAAAVVLALGATGLVLAVLDSRRADARWDALAELGWPLVDLGEPVAEVWRTDVGGGWPTVVTSDVVVVEEWSPTASGSTWRALDVTTGATVWEHQARGSGWCSPWNPEWSELDEGALGYGPAQVALGLTGRVDPTLLLCSDASFSGALPQPGETSSLRVLDLAGGREVDVVVEGSLLSHDPVGGDVIVTAVLADGTLGLTRAGLRTGADVWARATDVVVVGPDGVFLGSWPTVRDGVVLVAGSDGEIDAVLDAETGEPATTVPEAMDVQAGLAGRLTLPDGSVAIVDYEITPMGDGSGSYLVGEPAVTVQGPDGAERFSVRGELWSPVFTDGSMADRVLVRGPGEGESSRVVALDVVTGEELWTTRAGWSSTLLQVDGVAVSGSGFISGIDLRTGEELWEHRGSNADLTMPVTDGSRLAVPVAEDGATFLVALDIRSGAEAWRVPTISDVQAVSVVDGGVLLGNGTTFVLYR